jgi:phosphatidylglycerophosphate synthase
MVVAIVARELAITGLRLLAASKHVVLAAEGYGKHKTVSQIVAIIAILILASHSQWGVWAKLVFSPWLPWTTEALKWVAVVLTCVSGVIYLWRNRHIYLADL